MGKTARPLGPKLSANHKDGNGCINMIGSHTAGTITRAPAAVRQACFRPKRRLHMSHALIIEDELLLAFSVEEALRNLGYLTFDIVQSAPEAIEAAERKCPDLIIADH